MKTNDLLLPRKLPKLIGYNEVMSNMGELANKGFEATFSSKNIVREQLLWNSAFTFSLNRNKIIHLYGEMIDVKDANGNVIGQKEADDPTQNWFLGKAIDTRWQLKPKGVWQIGEEAEAAKYGAVPGDFRIEKREKPAEGSPSSAYTLTNDDKEFLGQTVPKFSWSFRNDITFRKNFNLSFLIYSNWGQIKEYNQPKNFRTSAQRRTDYIIPYWTPDNPINTHARLFSRDPAEFTIWWDNSFIRLDNIALSYNVPQQISKRAAIQNLRLIFTIRNVAHWAPKWEFWDPENSGPTPRYFTFGLNMTL